jgi:hypothetical protein
MAGAAEPQTDRELLLQINAEVKSLKTGLTASVERLNDILSDMKETEIKELNRKINELQQWRSELSGGWKIAMIVWTLVTGFITFFVNKFSK